MGLLSDCLIRSFSAASNSCFCSDQYVRSNIFWIYDYVGKKFIRP